MILNYKQYPDTEIPLIHYSICTTFELFNTFSQYFNIYRYFLGIRNPEFQIENRANSILPSENVQFVGR